MGFVRIGSDPYRFHHYSSSQRYADTHALVYTDADSDADGIAVRITYGNAYRVAFRIADGDAYRHSDWYAYDNADASDDTNADPAGTGT
jgi:hypothetical protein